MADQIQSKKNPCEMAGIVLAKMNKHKKGKRAKQIQSKEENKREMAGIVVAKMLKEKVQKMKEPIQPKEEKWCEESQEDYEISSFFPSEVEYQLRPLIEYKIKLLLKNNVILEQGESQVVATACQISKKLETLSIQLKGCEYLPVTFESDGYISPEHKGRIVVKLANYTNNIVNINSGTAVGYAIVQPFVLS